jgi:hypothetical protein
VRAADLRHPTLAIPLATLATFSVLMFGTTPLSTAATTGSAIRRQAAVQIEVPRSTSASPLKSSYPANIEYDPLGYGTYNKGALTNPRIGAVDINLNWYQVEPQPGVFNLGPADQEIAAWTKEGKKVTLELRFQHELNVPAETCTSDGWLPTWEAAKVPTFCEQRNDGTGLLVPDYFDPTFQSDWRQYVAAVASHYASSKYAGDVAYVRVALGLGAESFPLEPCYHPSVRGCSAAAYRATVQELRTWGWTASSWLTWQEGLLSYYKSEFAFTTVIYPINQMMSPTSNPLNTNPATGNPIDMDVAYWAAAHGMGIGQQGLDGMYTNDYAKFNEIAAYVRKHHPTAYIQFQTVAAVSSRGTSACIATCLFQKDVQAAEHFHARSIEWYSADDTVPSFQSYLALWQQHVDRYFPGHAEHPARRHSGE